MSRLSRLSPSLLLLFVSLLMLAASGTEWAGSITVPHGAWFDRIYAVLDPLALCLISGAVSYGCLFWPWLGCRTYRGYVRALVTICVCLLVTLSAAFVMERLLKITFGRARPRAGLEHRLVAAMLEGRLTLEQAGRLKGDMFACPIGRLVFAVDSGGPAPSADAIASALERVGLSRVKSQDHLDTIRNRSGLERQVRDIDVDITRLNDLASWRAKSHGPFLVSFLGRHEAPCDTTGGSPSGHVLAQSLLCFLAFLVARYYSDRVPVFRKHLWSRWVYLGLNVGALVIVVWSRLYGYWHSLADEIVSIAVVLPLFPIGALNYLSASHSLGSLGADHLMKEAQALIVYIDRFDRVIVWNRECKRVTGFDGTDIQTLGDYITKLYPDADAGEVRKRLRRVIDERWVARNVLTQVATKSGQRKLILWNATYVTDIANRVVGKLSVGLEVSRVRQKLNELGFAAAALLQDMSGDLRVIRALASQDNVGWSEVAHDAMRTVARIANKVVQSCGELEGYVRGTDAVTAVDMQNVFAFVQMVMQGSAGRAGLSLVMKVDVDVPEIVGKPIQIQQVLISIVRFAIGTIAEREDSEKEIVPRLEIRAVRGSGQEAENVIIELDDPNNLLPSGQLKQLDDEALDEGVAIEGRRRGLDLVLSFLATREYGGRLVEYSHLERRGLGIALRIAAKTNADEGQGSRVVG